MVRKNQFSKNKPPRDAATGRFLPRQVPEPSLSSHGEASKAKDTHPPLPAEEMQTEGHQETLEKQLLVEAGAKQNPSTYNGGLPRTSLHVMRRREGFFPAPRMESHSHYCHPTGKLPRRTHIHRFLLRTYKPKAAQRQMRGRTTLLLRRTPTEELQSPHNRR